MVSVQTTTTQMLDVVGVISHRRRSNADEAQPDFNNRITKIRTRFEK
jgi:hypothetical protein